jgi:hypothetical protein
MQQRQRSDGRWRPVRNWRPGGDGSTGVLGAVVGNVLVASDGGTSGVGDDVLA